jgi:maleate isomerase
MKCRPEQRTFDLDYKAELAEFTKTLSPRSHPILLPSTSLNSLDLIPDFERIAGRPVLTANQLCLWYALQLLEPKRGVSGAGRLFAEGKLRAKAAKSA